MKRLTDCRRTVLLITLNLTLMATMLSANERDGKDSIAGRVDPGVARTFSELRDYVRLGDTLYVTGRDGRKLKGKLEGITKNGTMIRLKADGTRRWLNETEVRRVELKDHDPLGNGALIGACVALGMVLDSFMDLCQSNGCTGEEISFFLFFGGLGAGVGVGIDALIQDRRSVYEAPRDRVEISLAPVLSNGTKGALLSIRF